MPRVQKNTDVKRDARINLAFTAELKKKLEDLASVDDVSVNALCEKICTIYVEGRAADIAALNNFRARIHERQPADDEPASAKK